MLADADEQALSTPVLSYDGRIGDLYRIFLVNLLLTVVTLGIWRFWAVTRMRRYVWSRTSSFGQRFEYDGTGGQLFVGFLIAVLLIFGMAAAAAFLTWLLAHLLPHPKALAVLPLFAFEILVVVLALGAPFSAQRYRLNHTVWRGIRGGVKGSMLAYGLRSLLYLVLCALTIYQLAPWAMLRLYERRTNASFFGNQHFAAATRARTIYRRFLFAFLGVLALAVLVFAALFVIERPMIAMIFQAHDPQAAQRAVNHLTPALVVAYLIIGLGGALISASFTAAYFRHITGHTRFGALQFSSQVTGMAMLVFTLGNIAILVCTLGFGMPVVIHRNLRFMAANLLGSGAPDLANLQASDQTVSRFGEGMFQALDAGAGIV
jgi:uncharacterized membrane protein YjgN (DUF898 family)